MKSRTKLILLSFFPFVLLLSTRFTFAFGNSFGAFVHRDLSLGRNWAEETKIGRNRPISSQQCRKISQVQPAGQVSSRERSPAHVITSLWYSFTSADGNGKYKTESRNNAKTNKRRKNKINKYAEFSKVDKVELDPFDSLLKESKQKMQAIESENKLQREQRSHTPPPPSKATTKLKFPNNKDIDPYDPSTFGYRKIGTIIGPHGVHGWVKVQGCTDFPERFTRAGMPLHLKPPRKRAPRKVTLSCGKFLGGDQFLIQLQGYFDRTASESLKHSTLYYATQQDTVVKEDDEILVPELFGLSVYRIRSGSTLKSLVGTVSGVVLAEELCAIPGLLHDQLEVEVARESQNNEHELIQNSPLDLLLIPMVPEIVIKINLEDGCILIDPPDGLLDLTYTREEKVIIKGLLPPARTE